MSPWSLMVNYTPEGNTIFHYQILQKYLSTATKPVKLAIVTAANDITENDFVTHSTLKKINHVISDRC